MNLNEMLEEAEVKKENNRISRFKVGDLTYNINAQKAKFVLKYENGEEETIEVIIPEIALSILAGAKRSMPEPKEDRRVGYLRREVRKKYSDIYNRSYKLLSKDEVEKFNAQKAMPEILDTMKNYISKYNPKYISFMPYSDNSDKRKNVYSIFLKREGFIEIGQSGAFKIYSKEGPENKIISITGPIKSNGSDFLRNTKRILRNF